MVRTQVQLAEEQLRELRRMAAEEGISLSELVRRGMAEMIRAKRRPGRQELMRRALEVAGKYRSGKHDIARRHDDYLAEAYRE